MAQLASLSAMLQRARRPTAVDQLQRKSLSQRPDGRAVVQRVVTVKDDIAKLNFVIDELGRHTKERFTNATEDQLTEFMRDVNVYWRAAYAGKKELTSGAAREALKPYDKQLLALLGKASPKPDDYQRLSNAIVTTFADDTDDRYRLATRKETQQSLPPGTVWWLDKVQSEKLIVPEDKSGDDRLKDCSKDHIVRTGADKNDTATALFQIEQQNSQVKEISEDDRAWELHGHVKKNGDVDLAHTKADGVHKVTVTDWFTSNIHVRDRAWDEL